MKEMRVLIESILPLDGEYLSGWFTLPIEAEVSERIGLNAFCGAQRTPMRFRADAVRSITDALKRLL